VKTITQHIAVKAVILNRTGELLMVREAKTHREGTIHGRYHFPGGRIEPGEPYEAALRREIFEEVGLTIEIGNPLSVGEWFPAIHGHPNHIVAVFFQCRTSDPEVRLGPEYDDYRWVHADAVARYELMPADTQAVRALEIR
jgi:8-oxo-dGTP diphosphatase